MKINVSHQLIDDLSTEIMGKIPCYMQDAAMYIDESFPKLLQAQYPSFSTMLEIINNNMGGPYIFDTPRDNGRNCVNELLNKFRQENKMALDTTNSVIATILLP